jgi:hypothetical protein
MGSSQQLNPRNAALISEIVATACRPSLATDQNIDPGSGE